MPPLLYRFMLTGEENAVYALVREGFARFVAPELTPQGRATFLAFVAPQALVARASSGGFVLVAGAPGGLAGMIEVRDDSHIALLFVAAPFQRTGVARELVRRAVRICLARRPSLACLTVNSSPYAVRIYRHLGFRPDGPERERDGIRFTPMVLEDLAGLITGGAAFAVRFASLEVARQILGSRDDFTARMTPHERYLRLPGKAASPGSAESRPLPPGAPPAEALRQAQGPLPTEEEFLRFAAAQALPWGPAYVAAVQPALATACARLARYQLDLPPMVDLVLTTGAEEGRAYTRGAAIILPAARVAPRPAMLASLEGLLVHELCHVFSRHDPRFRDRLYAALGFQPLDPPGSEGPSEIVLPDSLLARKLTNPDAPRLGHYICVTHAGRPLVTVPIMLLGRGQDDEEVSGDGFFDRAECLLLALEREGGFWRPCDLDGIPLLLSPDQVTGFYEQAGRNADHPDQPEELLASNLTLLLMGMGGPRSPEVIERLVAVLAERAPLSLQAPAG